MLSFEAYHAEMEAERKLAMRSKIRGDLEWWIHHNPSSFPNGPCASPTVTVRQLGAIMLPVLALFRDIPVPSLAIEGPGHFPPPVMATAHYESRPHRICFNTVYLISPDFQEIENTLKHELVHAWICWKGVRDDGFHGEQFKKKARQVGCEFSRKI